MNVTLRIGLLRLADSVPVLMARDLGLFGQAGLSVEIVVEPSWSNIADGLSWGRLDAAAVFPPLAIMTALGKRGRPTPLRIAGNLSLGGNTIVLRDASCLDKAAPRFAVVHPYSTHFLLLRRYLLDQCPRALDHLVIMPPDTMLDALRRGAIDGFCAGPPWGTAAEQEGLGQVVSGSAAICPGHVEKQLVVTEAWSRRHVGHAELPGHVVSTSIARSLDPANKEKIVDVLTRPLAGGGLALPAAALRAALPGCGNPHAFMLPRPNDDAAITWHCDEMRALGWIGPGDDLSAWGL